MAVVAARVITWPRIRLADARYFQLLALGTLTVFGIVLFQFGASPQQTACSIGATLGTQWVFSRLRGEAFDWRSPLITGFSLALLLRSNEPGIWMTAGGLAMASKFLLRVNGKHIFNPACAAIVALLLLAPDAAWVSPGQWGHQVWLGFLLTCLAGLVLSGAGRGGTALGFLGCYGGLLLLRALILGDPLAIPLHQMQAGGLLIFAFFMVTDPRSTPDSALGRGVFVVAVAALAYKFQFDWQMREGLFFALACIAPLTPLLDRLWPAPRFVWRPTRETQECASSAACLRR
jgi:Na+-transporting NADH:ubiquinone oxidoreductase subunit NqrB